MTKQEFNQTIKKSILKYMPADVSVESVEINSIYKTNDVCLNGLNIKAEGENTTPNIYLEPFYEMYKDGKSMECIMEEIVGVYKNSELQRPETQDISLKYEDVKDKVVFHVVEMKRNKNRLSNLEYTPLGNGLAMTYAIIVNSDAKGEAKIGITRQISQQNGYDMSKLHSDAIDNSVRLNPVILSNMETVMDAMLGRAECNPPLLKDDMEIDKDSPMYVLSNVNGVQGAATLFYPGVQEQISNVISDNYFVLPSSVHELLVIPEKTGNKASELEQMVREVNSTQVAPDEILSDRVLHYDRESKQLTQPTSQDRERDASQREAR